MLSFPPDWTFLAQIIIFVIVWACMRKFLFEPNNLETQRQISKRIDQQVDKYMPFVSIRDVYVGPLDDDIHSIHHNSLHITIKYLVPHMAEQDILSIAIPNERDVSAGETFSGGY